MEFKFGISAFSSGGKQAGSLHRVVIDPETMNVTHVVIERGILTKQDKVIPIENIASSSQEGVNLTCTDDELKEMSPLEIEQYTPISEPSEQVRKYDPLSGGMYWNQTSERFVVTETRRTIPDQLVALKEGARVFSADDEQMGNIEGVLTAPESAEVVQFSMSQGLMFKSTRSIPIEWVDILDEESVRLTVEAHHLEDPPEL